MLNYTRLNAALESKEPAWNALDAVYNSVQGDHKAKSTEVAELVSKFVTHHLICTVNDLNDREAVRSQAVKLISEINEDYPFNTTVCIRNVVAGCATYALLNNNAVQLDQIDDILTVLIRGQAMPSTVPATESLKDKIINGVKSIFKKDEKDKSAADKAKKVNTDKPKPADKPQKEEKPDAKPSKEDDDIEGMVESDSPEVPVEPPTTNRQEVPEQPHQASQQTEVPKLTSAKTELPDPEQVPEPVMNQVDAHRVAWEILVMNYGKVGE